MNRNHWKDGVAAQIGPGRTLFVFIIFLRSDGVTGNDVWHTKYPQYNDLHVVNTTTVKSKVSLGPGIKIV